jgi:hypothetical protein
MAGSSAREKRLSAVSGQAQAGRSGGDQKIPPPSSLPDSDFGVCQRCFA